MSSGCIASCIQDARVPERHTYVSLHRWPESDAEFVRSVARGNRGKEGPRVVDSISCRQMYLRSYTFSRKETMPERTRKCIGKVKERVASRKKAKGYSGSKKRCFLISRVKEVSCSALLKAFNRLLSCTTSVDVVDRKNL